MACKGHRLGATLLCQAGRYDTRQLCLEAGIAYLVVVGEGGACRCPFGVRHQQRVSRLSGTTAPRHDKMHQLTNPCEHLFPRLAWYGVSVSLWVWGARLPAASDRRTPPAAVGGCDRGRSRPCASLPPEGAPTGRQPLRRLTAAWSADRGWRPAGRPHPRRARYRFRA
jgi:hypothetical protein